MINMKHTEMYRLRREFMFLDIMQANGLRIDLWTCYAVRNQIIIDLTFGEL